MSENKILFEVDGVKVRKNSILVLKDKRDLNAPTGFRERGATKLPSSGVGETFHCAYKGSNLNGKNGVWDTGFYPESPMYASLSRDEAVEKAKQAKENVMEVYAPVIGGQDKMHHTNDEFWLNQRFSVETGKRYDTDKPEDLFELYFTLIKRQAVPKEIEKNPKYRHAPYVLVDINKDKKVKDEKAVTKFTVIKRFGDTLEKDRNLLVSVLEYIDLRVHEGIDDDGLTSLFDEFISMSPDNIDAFLRILDEAEGKGYGRDKIEIFRRLKKVSRKGNKIYKNNGVYFYDDGKEGQEIGGDLRTAAERIAREEKFEEIKKEILLGDDD